MSDYSFLRTGFSNLVEPTKISNDEREDIEIMLGLFTSNAIINASKYAEMCKRNAVTKTDMLYGLQYEVFEFLQRPDLEEGLREIKEEYEQMNEDDDDSEYDDEGNDEGNDEDKVDTKDSDSQTTEELHMEEIIPTATSEGSELSELSRIESHNSPKDEGAEEEEKNEKEDGDIEDPKSVTFVDNN